MAEHVIEVLFYLFVCVAVAATSSDHVTSVRWSVNEEQEPNSILGDLRRSLSEFIDPKLIAGYEFSFLPRPNQDLSALALEKETGIVRTSAAKKLDREKICPHHRLPSQECIIDVSVGLLKSLQLEQIASLKIVVVDINDNAPTFAQPQYDIRLSEIAPPGSSFPLPTATDADATPKFGVAGYRLKSQLPQFQLSADGLSGSNQEPRLILTAGLRLDSGPYTLELEAFDGGEPAALSGSTTIIVSVEDANDHAPTFEKPVVTIMVREDFPLDEPVFVARAHDEDRGANAELSYILETASQLQFGRMFTLNRGTGELFLRQPLDYERETDYQLVIMAIDSGTEPLTGRQTVIVQVSDVNDNAPLVTINTLNGGGGRTARINENSDIGSFVAHISVFDADNGPSGQVTCQLDDTSASTFQLSRLVAGQYKLTTLRKLDFELETLLAAVITCSDSGESPLLTVVNVTVDIVDVNDNSPLFTQSSYSVSVHENNVPDMSIIQVKAVDVDSGINGDIRYSIRGDNISRLIYVDDRTGIVRLSSSLDRETNRRIAFHVVAKDSAENPRSASAEVIINVEDVNDEEPMFVQAAYTFTVAENSASGTFVGHVSALDRDLPPFNRFVYKLVDAYSTGVADHFAIDPRSGKIIATKQFDREAMDRYSFSVTAIDEDMPVLRSEVPVTVEISDVNDHRPTFEFPAENNRTFHVSSAVPIGFAIIRVVARDRDIGPNAELIFRVNEASGEEMFAINSTSGVLSTSSDLSHIIYQSFQLRVTVTDLGLPPRTSSLDLIITVDSAIPYTDRLHHDRRNDADGISDEISFLFSNLPLLVIIVGGGVIFVLVLIIVAALLVRACHGRHGNGARRAPPGNVYRCRAQEEKAAMRSAAASTTAAVASVDSAEKGGFGVVTTVVVTNGNQTGLVTTSSVSSLHSQKQCHNVGSSCVVAGKTLTCSSPHCDDDELTRPLMMTPSEAKLLQALKEDLSDIDCDELDTTPVRDNHGELDVCCQNSIGSCCDQRPYPGCMSSCSSLSRINSNGLRQLPLASPSSLLPNGSCLIPQQQQQQQHQFPQFHTLNSTFKQHQHPLTYNGLTQPTVPGTRVGRDHYATLGAGGGAGNGMLSYQFGNRFPAHCAALSCRNRPTDYGYFTDERRQSGSDGNSPLGSP